MSEARIWLVYSREHEAWWRPASAGYTMSIAEAGRYTKAEAARHCTSVDRMSDGQTKEFTHLAPEVADRIEELERDVTVTWPTRVAKCGTRIAELEAGRDRVLTEADDFHCSVASALGWDSKGKSMHECVRELVAIVEKLQQDKANDQPETD